MAENEDRPSPLLVKQRIRNNVIEYLELASSYEEQLRYQANVPIAFVPHEVIEQWRDSVHEGRLDDYDEPVYSREENAAMRRFEAVWDSVCDDTPQRLPELSELIGTEPWERLRLAAKEALDIFEARGKFDWDRCLFE